MYEFDICSDTEQQSVKKEESDVQENDEVLICNPCKVKFPNKEKLSNHFMNAHTKILCQCKHCNFQFEKPIFLSVHLVSEHSEDPIPNKILQSSEQYYPDNKPKNYRGLYICRLCPIVKRRRPLHIKGSYNKLKTHMSFGHTTAASRCKNCKDLFESRAHASYHTLTYCKAKENKCFICGLKFKKFEKKK